MSKDETALLAEVLKTKRPRAGDMIKHYKGNTYRVIGLAILEKTLGLAVVYTDEILTWVRPHQEMFEVVSNQEGRPVSRFTIIDP